MPSPRISVYYPRGVRTGGPEALHQLVHTLVEQGHDAVLTPMPGTESTPRCAAYRSYSAPEAADARGTRGLRRFS